MSDDIKKYPRNFPRFDGLQLNHRDDLDRVQKQFREIEGTSVIIYDQTCAAEKRRRRKKKLMPDPPRRVFINEDVCEGCGDCSVASNCLSVLPKETETGRKRIIDQSACNKDFSCLDGFCPSFVTVEGGQRRKKTSELSDIVFADIPNPQCPELDKPWNILVAGVGGTGVLTVSAILAMAAYIEGKGCSSLNQTGLAQKFGAVISHVRIANTQEDIFAARIAAGDADLLIGCDLVVSDSDEALAKLHKARSYAVINDFESPTFEFIKNPDITFPSQDMKNSIAHEIADGNAYFVNATAIATALFGDSIASNMFLMGYAYQMGLIPLSSESIEQALELNNVAVEFNKRAFLWGRRAAFDLAAVRTLVDKSIPSFAPLTKLDDIVSWREQSLIEYQDEKYAKSYTDFIAAVKDIDEKIPDTQFDFTKAVAKSLYKLMAYKDEYEVARMFSSDKFKRKIEQEFEGDYRLNYHLAAPLVSRKDSETGYLIKRSYPAFMSVIFSLLAKVKFLRGTRWDIFSYTQERRMERKLPEEYRELVSSLCASPKPEAYDLMVEIAGLAQTIRGYGHVKEKSVEKYQRELATLSSRYQKGGNEEEKIIAYEVA